MSCSAQFSASVPVVCPTLIDCNMDPFGLAASSACHPIEANPPHQHIQLQRLSDFSIEHILHRAGGSRRPPAVDGRQMRPASSSSSPTSSINEDYAVRTSDLVRQEIGDQPQRNPHPQHPQHIHQRQQQLVHRFGELNACAPLFNWLQYTRYHPPRPQKSCWKPMTTSTPAAAAVPVRRTPGRLPRVPFSGAQLSALEQAYRQSTYLSSEAANRLAERLDLTSTRVKIWFQNRRARERRERRERDADGGNGSATSALTAADGGEPRWMLEFEASR